MTGDMDTRRWTLYVCPDCGHAIDDWLWDEQDCEEKGMPACPNSGSHGQLEMERFVVVPEQRAVQAEKDRAFTQQWYAERIEAIREEAKRVGNWDRVASILANGTPSALDPPTYAQQLNLAKHRAEAAESECLSLRREVEQLREENEARRAALWSAISWLGRIERDREYPSLVSEAAALAETQIRAALSASRPVAQTPDGS